MAETENGRSWGTAPGWVKLVLVLSLSANVAIVGLVGGYSMRHHAGEDGPGGHVENVPGLSRQQSRILGMVPEERREQARAILVSRTAEIDAARDALRGAHQALIEALRQDPLDPARLNTALAERQAASARVWGIGYEQMVEIARDLSPAERAVLADRLDERTRQWMDRQAARQGQ